MHSVVSIPAAKSILANHEEKTFQENIPLPCYISIKTEIREYKNLNSRENILYRRIQDI